MATTFHSKLNRAYTTLDAALTDVALSFVCTAGEGARFPANTFHIQIGDDAQGYEIVHCSARVVDTFTIVRAQEGTAALPFDAGTQVRHTHTAEMMTEVQTALNTVEDAYVTGPATATDEAVVRFNLATGKLVQNSNCTINDTGDVVVAGDLTVTGNDIKSSTATALTLSGANVTVPGTLTVNGNTILGDAATDTVAVHGEATTVAANTPSRLFRSANPKNHAINGDFEVWLSGTAVAPTGWNASATVEREATIVKLGTYSLQCDFDANYEYCRLTSPIPVATAIGRTFTFAAWIYTPNAAKTRLQITYTGSAQSAIKYATLTNTWERVAVTDTVPAGVTAIFFSCACSTALADAFTAYFDGATITEGTEEWAYERSDNRLKSLSVAHSSWHNATDSSNIGLVDADDPYWFGRVLIWDDVGQSLSDWACTSFAIPQDYCQTVDSLWIVVNWAKSATEAGTPRTGPDLQTIKDAPGAALGSAVDYTYAVGTDTANVQQAVWKVTTTGWVPGDTITIQIRREEDGNAGATATLYVLGAQLVYVAK